MSKRTVSRSITMRHAYTKSERDAYARILSGRGQLNKDEKLLIGSVQLDPVAKQAAKLADYNSTPEVALSSNYATLTFKVMETVIEEDKPKVETPRAQIVRPTIHIEPRTLNALLNGPLLSDEEKRKLLERILPDGVLTNPSDPDWVLDCGAKA